MVNSLIFVVLPYAAIALFAVATPYRYRTNRLSWSAYSTQFLERKKLFWGSNPWHYGIVPVLAAHVVWVAIPGRIKVMLADPDTLIAVESIGLGLALFALFGCIVLLARRITTPSVQGASTLADWALLVLLLFLTATGVYMGVFLRWGSRWFLDTAAPYLRSLLALNPQLELLADAPLVFKLHAAAAFLLVALVPFTKMVHVLFFPLDFLKDPPILYRWRQTPKAN
jgi:nitrate reductase gamma subunit